MEEKEKKSLAILLPCYKQIPTVTFRSIISLFMNVDDYYDMTYYIQDGMYIPMGRNMLVENLRRGGDLNNIDLILWIDSDQVWHFTDILDLLHNYQKNDYDILSAKIHIRRPNLGSDRDLIPMAYFFDQEDKPLLVPLNRDSDITTIESCGFGCLVMSGKVLQKVIDTLEPGEMLFNTGYVNNVFTGEDVWFFKRCKKLGLKVGMDNKVLVGHYGFSR